jgi:uncharacterized protein (TIGR03118 family)
MTIQSNAGRIAVETMEPRLLFAKTPLFTIDNLVSDNTKTIPALHQDTNVMDAWGLAAGPGTEWWVANNGTGTSTLYDGAGSPDSLIVSLPTATGQHGVAHPTGEVFNGTNGFQVASNAPAQFIFDTEDGTISGWAPGADPTHAIKAVDNSASGAVYKGLANDTVGNSNFILATNIHTGKVEVYDSSFHIAHLTGSFHDTKIPKGYSPFGIQNINGLIYVTYAEQDATKSGDVPGLGHGYLDVYLPNGVLDRRLSKRGTLDSPWGIARIPAGFGKFSKDIAVGNFGNGFIQVFDAKVGTFLGNLKKTNNKAIRIAGLWALEFGNNGLAGNSNELFFTAGPNAEADGLFGKLELDANSVSSVSTNPGGGGGYIYPTSVTTSQSPLFGTNTIADKTIGAQIDSPADTPVI